MVYLKSNFFSLLLFVLIFSSACSSAEEDYKSNVPVTQFSDSSRFPLVSTGASMSSGSTVSSSLQSQLETLPEQINLDVAFFPQAPDADWSLPWQEACEEASIVLAHAYATAIKLSKETFKQKIHDLVTYQNTTFGDYEHTDIVQTLQMIREQLDYQNAEILTEPSILDLKQALAMGHVIVAPFAGKQLQNPFYTNGGPVYHMLVIKGYDQENFITNDVGTRRGADFIYPQSRIMEALHDWHASDIKQGGKRVIVFH